MEGDLSLQLADYVVISIMLLIPLGIGLFYAWKDSDKNTRDEYLLGGRKMQTLPVALSMFVSFQSAVSLLGIPSDTYQNGAMIFGIYVAVGFGFLVGYFTLIPLMFPLRLTSIYEYLERRYKSRSVRMLSTCIGLMQTLFYMVIVLLAPGLAVQTAVGIPLWMCVFIVGGIGTLYTTLGGIKSVVWTDVFQTLIVFIGLTVLGVKGILAVGGMDKVLTIAENGGRTNLYSFSPDPRTRHTWWGMAFGVTCTWLNNIYHQANMQRVSSMRSMKDAKTMYLLNFPLSIVYGAMVTFLGIIVYSYFYHLRCDPLQSGLISNINQIVPFFMMHILKDFPGMAGLFMSALFSGALSTLSSGVNALAANTVEDIMGSRLAGVSERSATIITKIVAGIYGVVIVGVTYLCRSLSGPLAQLAISVFGSLGSVVLGMFLMGSTVPWANKYGAFAGGAVSLALNLWIVIGGMLYGKAIRPLSPVPSDKCYIEGNLTDIFPVTTQISTMDNVNRNTTSISVIISSSSAVHVMDSEMHDPYANGNFFYDLSYEWYSLYGVVFCAVIGLSVSWLTKGYIKTEVEPEYIIPIIRRFWLLDNEEKDDLEKPKQRMSSLEKEAEDGKCDVEMNSLLNDKSM